MKKVLSMLLALVMVLALLPAGIMTASAAEQGTLIFNPIVLKNDQWYTKYWTHDNYDLNCYNEIVVPSRGYITFTASKPYDDEGELCSYDLILYDESGNVVWAADTGAQTDTFSANYTYKIGLAAGTYYMNIDPSFYVYSFSAPIETQHKYKFTKSSYWEIESNNDKSLATQLTIGKKYYGVYRDESYDTSYNDYFKVKLTKGLRYRLTIGNYTELEAGTLIEDMYDPSGEDILPYQHKESGKSSYWIIDAKMSGWYYVLFQNDGHDAGTEYTISVTKEKIKASELTAKLSCSSYTYNGKKKTPSVTVKFGSKKLKKGTDYTVKYSSSSRKSVGKYKVTITFKGNYTGKKTLYFTINPASVSVKKVTQKKDKITVSYGKKSGITGYQVQCSDGSGFNSKWNDITTKAVKGYKTTTAKFSLDDWGTHYFRVRTYKTVNGKKYYSSWSKVKKFYVDSSIYD